MFGCCRRYPVCRHFSRASLRLGCPPHSTGGCTPVESRRFRSLPRHLPTRVSARLCVRWPGQSARCSCLTHTCTLTLRHYPSGWITNTLRFWNEQYILQAFLIGNVQWQVHYMVSADRILLFPSCFTLSLFQCNLFSLRNSSFVKEHLASPGGGCVLLLTVCAAC